MNNKQRPDSKPEHIARDSSAGLFLTPMIGSRGKPRATLPKFKILF